MSLLILGHSLTLVAHIVILAAYIQLWANK